MKKAKVVILAAECDSSAFIYNALEKDFIIKQVVIEQPVSKKILISRRIKKLGLFRVCGQIIFMIYNIFLQKISKRRISEIKLNEGLCNDPISENLITRVSSINSSETVDILKNVEADVIVVNGTRIITSDVLECIEAPFINTHSGITPKYRGVHGGYWALAASDKENCGVTVHLVDKGIDTGGVLYQGIINITDDDNFNSYPYLQIAVAIPLIKNAISDCCNKLIKVKQVALPSILWSHPTIFQYLFYRIFKGVK